MANMFQRLVDRAAVNDDYDDFDEEYDDAYLDEDVEEETTGEVTLRSVDDLEDEAEFARIVTVWPSSFEDVQEFADQFRAGVPVILNLTNAQEEARYRIVDFAAGVCYGLHGQLTKVSNDVLVMAPRSVKMEMRRTMRDRLR